MLFVACSGFPVPVSRYWGEFPAVEISDTEIAVPGRGTIRRWIREAPGDFAFTLLAPRAIAEAGFKKNAEAERALDAVWALGEELRARAVVFVAADAFGPTKAHRGALASFAKRLPKSGPVPTFSLPAWTPDQVMETVSRDHAAAAYDPLAHDRPFAGGALRYLRLVGPAGHRSRYDDAALDAIAAHIHALDDLEERDTYCVFGNIDMHTNVAQLRTRL